MSQPTFPINVDNKNYSLILPDWETDYIQGMLAKKSTPYELAMLQAMGDLLSDGDLVLDVGANIGNHTLYLAVVCGCHVIAFEPNPILFSPLRESIALNELEDQVSVIPKGVGATKARGMFVSLNPSNLGSQSLTLVKESIPTETERVEVIPLDSLVFDQSVKAIKIDVEGMELDVLKGAEKLLERDKPSLFIESHNEEQFLAIYNRLKKWGYIYWRTFNATPTNCFLPSELLQKMDLQQNSLEQGKAFYKLWDQKERLRKSMVGLQHRLSKAERNRSTLKDSCLESYLELDFSLSEDQYLG